MTDETGDQPWPCPTCGRTDPHSHLTVEDTDRGRKTSYSGPGFESWGCDESWRT